MASDRVANVHLMATSARLTTELVAMNKKLVVSLHTKRASHSIRRWRDRSSCVRKAGTGPPSIVETAGGVNLDPPNHYCWTCGPGCRHNSAKFPKLAADHIYTTTKM